jgi:hypothetical protein
LQPPDAIVMTNEIEWLAEVLADELYDPNRYVGWQNHTDLAKAPYRRAARAFLTAMREPSEAVQEAGARGIAAAWFAEVNHPVDRRSCDYSDVDFRTAKSAFSAMIDALLAPTPSDKVEG